MKNPNIKNTKEQHQQLGLDMDEQEMNGLYGMAETNEEDAINNSNSQQKQ